VPIDAEWLKFFLVQIAVMATKGQLTRLELNSDEGLCATNITAVRVSKSW